MANTKSAKKNVRKNLARQKINLARKSTVKTALKKALSAMSSNEKLDTVKDLVRSAESEISRSKHKIFHKNTVARKVSRLNKKLAEFEAGKSK